PPPPLQRDDLVFPRLPKEPAAILDVLPHGLLLAVEAEADFSEEDRRGLTHRVNLPPPIRHQPTAGKDAGIEEQTLHSLAHDLAGGGQEDTSRFGVAVASIVSEKERSRSRLRRTEYRVGHFLEPRCETHLHPQVLEQNLQFLGTELHAPATVSP